MNFFRKSPAQIAGNKAGKAWQTILYQTGEDIETLTGLDMYNHAQEEARKWVRSTYSTNSWLWTPQERKYPENLHHEQFTEYVEAFVSAFPSRIQGYPKE
jgi:hypothetical protein